MSTDTKEVKGFDVLDLMKEDAVEATHRVPVIFDADGEEVSGFIIVGKNSKQYQDIQEKLRAEGIMRASRRKTGIDTATEEGAAQVVATLGSNDQRTANAVVVGWFGFKRGEDVLEFDPDFVKIMLEKKPLWKDLVLKALENDGNFTKV